MGTSVGRRGALPLFLAVLLGAGCVTPRREFGGHFLVVWSVDVSGDGQRVLTSGGTGTVRLWDATNGALLQEVQTGGAAIGARFVGDGKVVTLATWFQDRRELVLRDAQTLAPLVVVPGKDAADRLATDERGQLVAVGGARRVELRRAAELASPWRTIPTTPALHWDLQLSADGGLAVGTVGGEVLLWSTADGRELLEYNRQLGSQWSDRWLFNGVSAPVPGEDRLVLAGRTSSDENAVLLLTRSTGTLEARLPDWDERISRVAWVPGRRWVVLAGDEGHVRVVDTRTGKERRTFRAHGSRIEALRVSADGKWLLTGGYESRVKLWALDDL